MASKEYEVIMMRQLASALTTPIFIVDPNGTLLYYNEPAEAILGHRFDETGEMPMTLWATTYTPTDEHSAPLTAEDLPLVVALKEHRPAHRDFWIVGRDNVRRHIDVIAYPLLAQGEILLGAVAIFWEDGRK